MHDLNTQITMLRQCVPDLARVNLYLDGLGADLHPIARDYLDQSCPSWRLHRVITALDHPHRPVTWRRHIDEADASFQHRTKSKGGISLIYTYAASANINLLWTPGLRVRVNNPFGYAYLDGLAAHLVGIDLACYGMLRADLEASRHVAGVADMIEAMDRVQGRWRWVGDTHVRASAARHAWREQTRGL